MKEQSMQASLETIQNFLAHKRIAMVGISRNPSDFSGKLFEEFCRHGYDMVPVNPNATQIHARRCFARLQDVQPPVEAVLLMTSPEVSDTVVGDCADAGV
jgi:predicted CoA-binding protein